MTRNSQTREEEFHLKLFKQLRPDLMPVSPIMKDPPAPDSIMVLPDRTVGIELTTFSREARRPSGSDARKLHSLRNRVVNRARQVWEFRKLPLISVSLSWNNCQDLLPENVDHLAVALVDLVVGHIPEVDAYFLLDYPNPGWQQIPEQVEYVYVSRPAGLTESRWSFSQGGIVSSFSDICDALQSHLDAKEPRVQTYRGHCDEVWLLMVADMVTIESYIVIDDKPLPTSNLVSSFDKAYLLSVASHSVVEISLSKPE